MRIVFFIRHKLKWFFIGIKIRKKIAISPDRSGNPFVPEFGTKDYSG